MKWKVRKLSGDTECMLCKTSSDSFSKFLCLIDHPSKLNLGESVAAHSHHRSHRAALHPVSIFGYLTVNAVSLTLILICLTWMFKNKTTLTKCNHKILFFFYFFQQNLLTSWKKTIRNVLQRTLGTFYDLINISFARNSPVRLNIFRKTENN